MYRPSRLIVQDVEDAKKVIPNILVMNESMRGAASAAIDCIETELQEGDTLTGFEIIAGLPLDEQTDSDMIYLYWQQAVGRIPLDGRTESAGL